MGGVVQRREGHINEHAVDGNGGPHRQLALQIQRGGAIQPREYRQHKQNFCRWQQGNARQLAIALPAHHLFQYFTR